MKMKRFEQHANWTWLLRASAVLLAVINAVYALA